MSVNSVLQINQFPKEVLGNHVFAQLSSLNDLYSFSQVCKLWCRLFLTPEYWDRFNIQILFPSLTILDQAAWKKKQIDKLMPDLSFEGIPVLSKFEYIKQAKRFFDDIKKRGLEGNDGVTDLTVPGQLTVGKLQKIAQHFHLFLFSDQIGIFNSDPLYKQFENIPVKHAYRVFITNSILKESCEEWTENQIEIAQGLKCTPPKLISLLTLMILRNINSDPSAPIRLYHDRLTVCVEEDLPLVNIGYFSEMTGIFIDSTHLFPTSRRGIAVERNIEAVSKT